MKSHNKNVEILKRKLSRYRKYYVDIRYESSYFCDIHYENNLLINEAINYKSGFFIRVNINGVWIQEYAGDITEIESIIESLIAFGKSLPMRQHLNMESKAGVHKTIKFSKNNFSLFSVDSKRNYLFPSLKVLNENPSIVSSHLIYKDKYSIKTIVSSHGREVSYDLNQACISSRYGVGNNSKIFRDQYDYFFVRKDDRLCKVDLRLLESINESRNFIGATKVFQGRYNLIFGPEVVGGFIHECFGHQAEADFHRRHELVNNKWSLNAKVFPDFFSVVDDNCLTDHVGYTPYDDEGTEGQRTYIVQNGVIKSRLHSLETSSQFNELPSGNGRAIDIEHEPIVRMTNTYLAAGNNTYEELLKMVNDGFYIKSFRSGTGMGGFSLTPIRSYVLKNGKIEDAVLIDMISGDVSETINNIVGISNSIEFHNTLLGGCGKSNQNNLPVSFGGPYVALKNVEVS